MLFNSTIYLVFLPTVVVLFYHLRPRQRQVLVFLASMIFYGYWSIPFLGLMLGSITVDFFSSRYIARHESHRGRRRALLFSIVYNLGVLGIFKYANFFSLSVHAWLGFQPWPLLDILLPVGISFYTFQTMSYTIDVYRGHMEPAKRWLDVALFVSFFPQLVAGPIVRAQHLMPQLDFEHREPDWDAIRGALGRITYGLVKKVFIADAMASYVNEAYGDPTQFGAGALSIATIAFAVQIYCDFSAYSDIAIGSARLLGVKVPENFDSPYLSLSIREFWRRWHISLSTWLRDYLYIPLGGSRAGPIRVNVNLMITMLLGGLWHGAGWNWVVWGGIQGVMLCIERPFNMLNQRGPLWAVPIRWIITMTIVMISWIFFRAASVDDAFLILQRIFTGATGTVALSWEPFAFFAAIVLADRWKLRDRFVRFCQDRPLLMFWMSVIAFAVFIIVFGSTRSPEFIYFQF